MRPERIPVAKPGSEPLCTVPEFGAAAIAFVDGPMSTQAVSVCCCLPALASTLAARSARPTVARSSSGRSTMRCSKGNPGWTLGETSLTGPAKSPRGMQAGRRKRLNLFRYLVFSVFGLFFILPLLAMLRFSLEGNQLGKWSLAAWKEIVSYPGPPPLLSSVEITLELAVITSAVVLVLLVPTMIWIRLRVQWIGRAFEFLCLLPLTIPGIVLVVGLAPIYNFIRHYQLSALQLFWCYVVLALPYAYRALSAGLGAIDVTTIDRK